jgi:hypothetical protein
MVVADINRVEVSKFSISAINNFNLAAIILKRVVRDV